MVINYLIVFFYKKNSVEMASALHWMTPLTRVYSKVKFSYKTPKAFLTFQWNKVKYSNSGEVEN